MSSTYSKNKKELFGSVVIALNADKLGIGSEPAEPTITPEDLRPDQEFTYNETNIRDALGIDFLKAF